MNLGYVSLLILRPLRDSVVSRQNSLYAPNIIFVALILAVMRIKDVCEDFDEQEG